MAEWHQTIWGIITLGAVGSISGVAVLKISGCVIDKLGVEILYKMFSGLFYKYAENQCFIEKCEENKRYDLIQINYSMNLAKYSRIQFIFVKNITITTLLWLWYAKYPSIIIVVPIVFSLLTFRNFYSFLVWYLAVAGSFPQKGREIAEEIKSEIQKDKSQFIKNSIEKFLT